MFKKYDIIVVGGGHAGCEAAASAANLGSSVLLITMNLANIAQMSCNPAMGGIAKGQIIREIDALGGLSGIVTDHTMIQFRMLNRSKGAAMWSPRAQSDRMMFSAKWRQLLEDIPNVHFWQDMVTEIIVQKGKATGVKTAHAIEIEANAVIITSGTFLNGRIHIGTQSFSGGRLGEHPSWGLTENLFAHGIESQRLKTGTPVRVDGRTIDFGKMTVQEGDENPGRFSFIDTPTLKNQRNCYLTYTNNTVHDILKEGFEQSPLFTGRIQGSGPRYCPSIEDKIDRFSSRDRHQLFIEPEGWNSNEYYVNGFSSSLPQDIQFRALKEIPGFENARILKPGYAIEYDYFSPTQLKASLESKKIESLFFAGQVNGTTGYEEAAAQGLLAGINAHRGQREQPPVILKRHQAYIGVLIDDLVTKGTNEPYRMFTSRAEFRLLLRQDNADQRLTPVGFDIGLASKERMTRLERKRKIIGEVEEFIKNENIKPEEVNQYLETHDSARTIRSTRMAKILLRPQVDFPGLIAHSKPLQRFLHGYSGEPTYKEIIEAVEINIKYEGYLEKEREIAEKIGRLEHVMLPEDMNYSTIKSLSAEAIEKLNMIKPGNIGQASRISGITPADISILLVYLGR